MKRNGITSPNNYILCETKPTADVFRWYLGIYLSFSFLFVLVWKGWSLKFIIFFKFFVIPCFFLKEISMVIPLCNSVSAYLTAGLFYEEMTQFGWLFQSRAAVVLNVILAWFHFEDLWVLCISSIFSYLIWIWNRPQHKLETEALRFHAEGTGRQIGYWEEVQKRNYILSWVTICYHGNCPQISVEGKQI